MNGRRLLTISMVFMRRTGQDGRDAASQKTGWMPRPSGSNSRPRQSGDNMNFLAAVKSGFSNYITFSGRASRSEFWYYHLFFAIGNAVAIMLDMTFFPDKPYTPLGSIFYLVTLLPTVAVSVRRLHDTDRSGWWYWLHAILVIGTIVLIVWFCKAGTSGANRYGADPLPGTVPA